VVLNLGGLGPGSPTPVTYTPRPIGKGKALQYQSKSGQIQADVGKGPQGTNNTASFSPRPPPKAPGTKGVGATGAFVDAKA
jgi:hypothetical protein